MLHSQLGIAVGGNGIGARSCDEIGRLAAAMILQDTWDSIIPRDSVRILFTRSVLDRESKL